MTVQKLKTKHTFLLFCFLWVVFWLSAQKTTSGEDTLLVSKCVDFDITGKGDNDEWKKTNWVQLAQLDVAKENYETKFKILYSKKGIYVLFYGKDKRITTTYEKDFDNLFNADVFEAFFHPNPDLSLYFEYEVNALSKELVLLIPNYKNSFMGWMPWQYEGRRKVQKKVDVDGGAAKSGATIQAWTAEVFFPYELVSIMSQAPESGAVWKANFCRLDYDEGKMVKWSWSPVESSFHEYQKFRSIKFE